MTAIALLLAASGQLQLHLNAAGGVAQRLPLRGLAHQPARPCSPTMSADHTRVAVDTLDTTVGLHPDDHVPLVYDDLIDSVLERRAAVLAHAAELSAAAEAIEDAAAELGSPTATFASRWAKELVQRHTSGRTLPSETEVGEFELLEECLVDSPACERLEAAIRKLQLLCGSWSGANA